MDFLYTFLVLYLITFTKAYRNNLVDPHEMVIDMEPHEINTNKPTLKKSFSENSIQGDQEHYKISSTEETMAVAYLRRTINLILHSASSSGQNSADVFVGTYQYLSNSEEHQFLMNFANSKEISAEDIRRLDTVLTILFSKPNQESMYGFNIGVSKEAFAEIFSIKSLVVLGIIVGLSILFILLRSNYGFLYIIGYFFSVILIVDYGIRYQRLYEEAEEHNLKLKYSSECDTNKMSWSEYFKFTLSRKNCDIKIITPLDVSLNQLRYIIVVPLESFGTGVGDFGAKLWGQLPFPWNFLLFPMMLAFTWCLVFLWVVAVKNTSFKLKLFHLFNIELGEDNTGNRISGRTVDRLLENLDHRLRLEDTRSTPPNEVPKKIKNKRPPSDRRQKSVTSDEPIKKSIKRNSSKSVDKIESSSKDDQNCNKTIDKTSDSENSSGTSSE